MDDIIQLSHGIWREPHAVADLSDRVAALLTGCAPGTVVSGITAARLHGLWLPTQLPAREPEPDVEVITHPELAIPSTRSGVRRSAVHGRRRKLRPDEITTLYGIPVTTEARTWFDLACRLNLPDLVAAGDSALRGSADFVEIAAVLEQSRRCPGVVRARAALPFLNPQSRSRPESHLRFGLVSAGLPAPDVNKSIFNDRGEWLAEPDLSYPDARLAIEYNGALHADPDRMRKDMTRGIDVIDGKWWSLSVGPVEVFQRMDRLASVVRQLRAERIAR